MNPPYTVTVEIADGVEKGDKWVMRPMHIWMGADEDAPPDPDYSGLDRYEIVVLALESALVTALTQRDKALADRQPR